MALMGSIPPCGEWSRLLRGSQLRTNGQPVGEPASHAQVHTGRRWCKTFSLNLLGPKRKWGSGVGWLGNPPCRHITAVTVQQTQLSPNSSSFLSLEYCKAAGLGVRQTWVWIQGVPQKEAVSLCTRLLALWGQGPGIIWLNIPSTSSNVYWMNKLMNEQMTWLINKLIFLPMISSLHIFFPPRHPINSGHCSYSSLCLALCQAHSRSLYIFAELNWTVCMLLIHFLLETTNLDKCIHFIWGTPPKECK